jgi:hypothetical protein
MKRGDFASTTISADRCYLVMAGLVPAIHAFLNADA